MAKKVKDLSVAGEIIEDMLVRTGTSKTKLIAELGISQQAFYSYLERDIRVSTFGKILEKMGYDVVIQKSTGLGTLRVVDNNPCENCVYQVVTRKMDEAFELLHAHASEAGREVDFTVDEPVNKES